MLLRVCGDDVVRGPRVGAPPGDDADQVEGVVGQLVDLWSMSYNFICYSCSRIMSAGPLQTLLCL